MFKCIPKLLLMVIFATACESDSQKSDSFNDSRNEKVYKTVKIGNQEWMAENLDEVRFRNGDLIPHAKSKEEWKKAAENKQPAWCHYDNDYPSEEKKGKLYNWYAVNDSRGLAPKGWHVPSEIEWTKLSDQLGGADLAGSKMKSTSGWRSRIDGKNGNGVNISGFAGIPFSIRDLDGHYFSFDWEVCWWSSSEGPANQIPCRMLGFGYDDLYNRPFKKGFGMSVRCIKD